MTTSIEESARVTLSDNPEHLPVLIDSHVHTDDDRFEPDRDAVLQAARQANVAAQIVPAVTVRLWPRIKQLCSDNADLYPCYGLHPCFCEQHSLQDITELAIWLGREGPVAVGECGLDYYQPGFDKAFQQQLFACAQSGRGCHTNDSCLGSHARSRTQL